MTVGFTESNVEQATFACLETVSWQIAHGPDIALDMPVAERDNYGQVVLLSMSSRRNAVSADCGKIIQLQLAPKCKNKHVGERADE